MHVCFTFSTQVKQVCLVDKNGRMQEIGDETCIPHVKYNMSVNLVHAATNEKRAFGVSGVMCWLRASAGTFVAMQRKTQRGCELCLTWSNPQN